MKNWPGPGRILLIAFGLMSAVNQAVAQVIFETTENTVVSVFNDQALNQRMADGLLKGEDIFKIFVKSDSGSTLSQGIPILGSYTVIPGQITFQPVIPFRPDIEFIAVFGDTLLHEFSFNESKAPLTKLINIYPSADTLPENLLKIYLEFTGPMREGEVYDKVYLAGPDGLVKEPFVPLQPELWDSSKQLLTLWIDPGRVKRSLGSRAAHGPVIEAGKRYKLSVDSTWKDAYGRAVKETQHKSFLVNKADRHKPVTENWQVNPPTVDTITPLRLLFDQPMDMSTTRKSFVVFNDQGQIVQGVVALGENEKSWIFTPGEIWKPGLYTIEINPVLEDLAGNNLNRVFDRDLSEASEIPSDKDNYQVRFQVLQKTN